MMTQDHTARLGLIRHGQTRWNAQKRIQGSRDLPLSARGRDEVQQWAIPLGNFHWEYIISSDLKRAIETAAILGRVFKVPVTADARLREQAWGRWEGKTMAWVKAREPELLAQASTAGWEFAPPDGESRLDVFNRGMAAIKDIVNTGEQQQVLVVAHQGIIKCLYYRLHLDVLKSPDPALLRFYWLHWFIFRQAHLLRLEANALKLKDTD